MTVCTRPEGATVGFQSTCHIRGMTISALADQQSFYISIHMPHTWHDALRSGFRAVPAEFQSTCHIRGMTHRHPVGDGTGQFQSTCHIRGMTSGKRGCWLVLTISIHMPHTWHDVLFFFLYPCDVISIHMPHTWHDICGLCIFTQTYLFQSTCHIRGMTPDRARQSVVYDNFNPHATYVA